MSEKTERIRKRVRLAGLGAERTFKKALVRRAGLQTEQEFFGPGGVFAKAGHTEHLKGNPGIEWAKEIANSLNVHLPVPYRHAYTSTLGGPERASVLLTVSLDPRETWANSILENSRHAKFHINAGVIELISGHGIPSFRKSRFKDTQGLFDVLQRWIRKAGQSNPRDFHNIEKSGFHRGQYVGYGGGTWKIRKYGTGEHLWIAVKQGGGGEFYGSSFADLSAKLDTLSSKSNPITVLGLGNPLRKSKPEWCYDAGMRAYILDLKGAVYNLRSTGDGFKYTFSVGSDIVHWSKTFPEIELAMDAIDHGQGKKFKRPPGIYGSTRITPKQNPAHRINTSIAGVLYNRCVEIRAEKTSAKGLKGLYYHPFLERSKVCVLALDNGDILIHSKAGEKLWKLD